MRNKLPGHDEFPLMASFCVQFCKTVDGLFVFQLQITWFSRQFNVQHCSHSHQIYFLEGKTDLMYKLFVF